MYSTVFYLFIYLYITIFYNLTRNNIIFLTIKQKLKNSNQQKTLNDSIMVILINSINFTTKHINNLN